MLVVQYMMMVLLVLLLGSRLFRFSSGEPPSLPARAAPQLPLPGQPWSSVDVMANEDRTVFRSFSVVVGLFCFRHLAKPALVIDFSLCLHGDRQSNRKLHRFQFVGAA